MRLILVALLAVGCRPLEPGETRCAVIGGVMNCKSGPPHPQQVIVQQPMQPVRRSYWCTTNPVDGFGACLASPGMCEVFREETNNDGVDFQPCVELAYAICAPSGCYTTAASCARAERGKGRDGAACEQR